MTAPEFSRPERLDAIGTAERQVTIRATPEECRALARRFELVAVDRLTGEFALRRDAVGVRVRGLVRAVVTQACAVTGAPLAAQVDERVDLLFTDPPGDGGDEVELGNDTIDIVFHDGAAVDVGEVAAETMALALDPFPRGPEADAALHQAGVLSERDAGPFGALADLLNKE